MKLIKGWYLPDEDMSFQKYFNQSQSYQFMNRLKYDTSRLKIKEEIEDEEEKKIIIKCKMRNNQYAKHFNVFDTIRYTNKIVCPWGHWKDTN